jgi:hypothetical protein
MIGERIGNYVVLRRLGQGGMGLVFEAFHEQIGRRAAIKILRPHLGQDPGAAARFLNEARAPTIVGHPGLISIFEGGQLKDGSAYLVMELLEGHSLAARLEQGLDRRQALLLFRQIASAMAAAHRCGIVHRDLKPENIMIVADPEVPGGERIKVLDFGIAHLTEALGSQASHTRAGTLLGTPTYMAPEQCRGLPVCEKADVYALGVMLYEALCGHPPFRGENAFDVMAMHVYDPPADLHDRDLPQGLSTLVLRLLAKAPADRPTMAEAAHALSGMLTAGVPAAAMERSFSAPALLPTCPAPGSQPLELDRDRAAPRRYLGTSLVAAATSLCTAAVVTLALQPEARRDRDGAAQAQADPWPASAPARGQAGVYRVPQTQPGPTPAAPAQPTPPGPAGSFDEDGATAQRTPIRPLRRAPTRPGLRSDRAFRPRPISTQTLPASDERPSWSRDPGISLGPGPEAPPYYADPERGPHRFGISQDNQKIDLVYDDSARDHRKK